jgi:hypothetical protein
MSSRTIKPNQAFLLLQLGLGVLWLLLLPWLPAARGAAQPSEMAISMMLLLAAWLPSLPLAIWQAQTRRRWWVLLLSDLAFALGLVLLSLTLYLPLFFTLVVWFWPFALLPRGLLSTALLRLGHQRGR